VGEFVFNGKTGRSQSETHTCLICLANHRRCQGKNADFSFDQRKSASKIKADVYSNPAFNMSH
jgi:hypothetical protein